MKRDLTSLLLLTACHFGCSSDFPEDAEIAHAPNTPFDASVCKTRPMLDGLEMLPAAPPILHYMNSQCEVDPASVLLVNTSDEAVRVEQVGVTAAELDGDSPVESSVEFSVTTVSLPMELVPGAALAIAVEFEAGAAEVTATGSLIVVTGQGCQELGVFQGISADAESGVTLGPLAIDFGVLQRGEVSEPLPVEFKLTPSRSGGGLHFTIRGAEPEDVFEVVSEFSAEISGTCDQANATVRMKAPSASGPVKGTLYYEVVTELASGIGTVSLHGLVAD